MPGFELGLLMGLGRSALREREERTRREREQQELAQQQSARSLGLLQRFVETDDLLPDDARSLAAQHLLQLSSNPKAKDTDFNKAVQDVWTTANRPRPSASPQSIATEATRRIAGADYSGLNLISPFSNMGNAAQDFGRNTILPQLPEPEMVSGLLTRDEIDARNQRKLRSQLELQQKFSRDPKALLGEGPDAFYTFSPEGQFIGRTPFVSAPAATTKLTEGDKELERAYSYYARLKGLPIEKVQSDPRLGAEAERAYADATGRSPRPVPAYMQSEPLIPTWNPATQQVVYTPRSQAVGMVAPRTTYDEFGVPTTGGVRGTALTQPAAVPTATQETLRGFDILEAQLSGAEPLIKSLNANGPLVGRIAKIKVNALGGHGATPQEEELIVRLRRLLSSQAFAEGGKQLTGTEKMEFEAIVPKPEDTVEQALIKLNLTREFVKNKRAAVMRYMPARQRAQLGVPTLPKVGPKVGDIMMTKGGQKIRIKSLSPDGTQVLDYEVVP